MLGAVARFRFLLTSTIFNLHFMLMAEAMTLKTSLGLIIAVSWSRISMKSDLFLFIQTILSIFAFLFFI